MSGNEARARELAFELPLSVGPHPPKWVTDRLAAALSAAELSGRVAELTALRALIAQRSATFPEYTEYASLISAIDSRLAALSRKETK